MSKRNPLYDTWWVVLGVSEGASVETIKEAYLTLSKVYHPDIGSAPDYPKWSEFGKAYSFAMVVKGNFSGVYW